MPHGTSVLTTQITDGHAKLVTFKVNRKKQFVTHQCYFYTVSPGTTQTPAIASDHLQFTDITRKLTNCAATCKNAAEQALMEQTRNQKNKYISYMHRYELNADTPNGMKLPILKGLQQIHHALDEWSPESIAEIFIRCVHAAKMATVFRPENIQNETQRNNAKRALYVMALRMFAGSYQQYPENIDDRSMPHIQFFTSHDCDDMAIAAMALATKVDTCDKAHFEKFTTTPRNDHSDLFSPVSILNSVKGTKTCMVIQGRLKNNGHTWAAIRCNGTYNGTLHVEATRLCVPNNISSLEQEYGTNTFATCHLHPDKDSIEMQAMYGVSMFSPESYGKPCAAYTHNSMHIVTDPQNTNIQQVYDNFNAHTTLMHAPEVSKDTQIIFDLFVTPSPTEISKGTECSVVKAIINPHDAMASALVTSNTGFVEARRHKTKEFYTITPGSYIVGVDKKS